MSALKEAALRYSEGMISAQEFLGIIINEVGREYEILRDDQGDTSVSVEFANTLMSKFMD